MLKDFDVGKKGESVVRGKEMQIVVEENSFLIGMRRYEDTIIILF